VLGLTLKDFLKYVEIQTKVASIIPFALGTLYANYRYKSFHVEIFSIMLISLLAFDMATTAINNYIDYKKSIMVGGKKHNKNNVISDSKIKESTAILVIFILLLLAVAFGIILTLKTNLLVLAMGIISFIVGILYTFGPIPISRMPLGEVFSGFFMGFIIVFLSIYVQIYDKNIILFAYNSGRIFLNINIIELIYIFLIAVPVMGGIANIMLANNICDIDEDIINKRFTLPYYLGKVNSLILFKSLYYIGYLDIIFLVIIGVAPFVMLFILLTFVSVNNGIKKFYKKQIKKETFILSVKNFVLMNVSQIIVMSLFILFTKMKG
jgi:1,4-dihydroxy-2-naphthoate polyprenyltransferase